MATTTINMPYDAEVHRRRVADLLKEIGGTEGHIGEVAMGTRIVRVPSPRPLNPAAPEGSYMARKFVEINSSPMCYGETPIPEKPLLLDKIHRYHLRALSLMGKEAVSRHARGMIFAGYTYGLLSDPAANIVANAIWYDSTFPPSSPEEAQTVKMLSAKAIVRMASRSLDALIAFLRHFAPALSIHEIWRCLASVDGNLQDAVSVLHKKSFGLGEQQIGFWAAVQASDLPSDTVREAHLAFVTRFDSARDIVVRHWLQMGLSSNISFFNPSPPVVPCEPYLVLGRHAMRQSSGTSTTNTLNLSPPAYRALRLKKHSFRMEEELSLDIVRLALQKVNLQLGGSYQLHMVCGKNYIIVPPNVYYHINFLASPRGDFNPPTLFFAEVCGACKDVNDVTLCCPLTEKKGRCVGCDTKGVKLIHPADVKFHGAQHGTEDRSLMPDPTSDFDAPLNEDYVFFGLNQHPWIAVFLEDRYSHMSDDQVDLSFCWFEKCLP